MIPKARLRWRAAGRLFGRRMPQMPGSSPAGGSVSPFAPLLVGLTNQWKLNEALGNALDSVGGFDLPEVGAVGSTAGKINNCRTNAMADCFERAATDAIAGVNVSFTWTAWVYVPVGAGGRIINIRNGGNFTVDIRHDGTNIVVFLGNGSGGFTAGDTIAAAPATDTWHHIAVAYDVVNDKLKTAINGVVSAEVTPVTHPTTLGGTVLGFFSNGAGGNNYIGRLDCIKLWSGLYQSNANIILDYNGGAGVEL